MKAPYLAISLLVLTMAGLAGLDWRTGLTFALVCIYFAFLTVHLESGIYIIVAAAVIFVDGWAPERSPEDVVFRLGLGRLYIMEIAVYGLLLIYALKRSLGWSPVSRRALFSLTPLDRPIIAFAALLPIFAFYGLLRRNPLQDAVGYFEWRLLFLAIIFYFLVVTMIQTPEKALRLFKLFLGIVVLKAVYFLIVYLLRAEYPVPDIFGAGPMDEGPENLMFLFAVLPAISYLSFQFKKDEKTRTVVVGAVIALCANLLLSAKRSTQSGFVIGLLFLLWRLPRGQRLKLAARAAAVLLAVTLLFAALGGKLGSRGIERSGARYEEVFAAFQNPQEVPTMNGTLAFHLLDLWDAWNVIQQRPLLGYGFGSHYDRQLTLLPGVGGEGAGLEPGVVHNQYLHIWWKMGFVGLAVYFWLLFRIFQFGSRAIDRFPSTASHAIALGLYSALLGELAILIWGPEWFSSTKASLMIFMSLALILRLVQANARTNDFAPVALVPGGVNSAS